MNTIKLIKSFRNKTEQNDTYTSNQNIQDIEELYNFLKQINIKLIWEKDKDLTIKRLIMYNTSPLTYYSTQYNLECNGLIYDWESNKPLVIPQITCITNYSKKKVINNYNKHLYNVVKIMDGTCINLYYYNNIWKISTIHGYDVTNLKWNDHEYMEILKSSVPKDFFDKLDKNKCYTFVISNIIYHPFVDKNKNCIIHVQNIDLSTLQISYKNNIYDQYSNVQINDQSIDENITLDEIFNICNKSINNFINKGDINYGYLLYFKNYAKIDIYSNVIIESSLLKNIKYFIYNNKLNQHISFCNYDRITYLCIYHYMDKNEFELFNKLFPQYSEIFHKIKIIIEQLTNVIYDMIFSENSDIIYDRLYISTVYVIKQLITDNISFKFCPDRNIRYNLINDYIRNKNFVVEMYFLYKGIDPYKNNQITNIQE